MKFSDYPYQRPDAEAFKETIRSCARRVREADSAEAQIKAFDEATALGMEFQTLSSLAYVRNTVNTAL